MDDSDIFQIIDVEPKEKGEQYVDEDCFDTFLREFSFWCLVDMGKDGIVVVVETRAPPYRRYALKISEYNEANTNGVVVAHELDQIRDETPVFAKTLGWFPCNVDLTKNAWFQSEGIFENDRVPSTLRGENMLLFQLMEYYRETMADTKRVFNRENALKMVFLIIHGLSVARRAMDFGHHDLHGGNIMFTPVGGPVDVVLQIGEQEHVSIKMGFLPKIIDFDTATVFSDQPVTTMDVFGAHSDVIRFRGTLKIARKEGKFTLGAAQVLKEIFKTSAWQAGENSGVDQPEYLDAILRLPQFRSIYTHAEGVQHIEEKCAVCHRVATQMWEGTQWKFCDGLCAYVHNSINSFV